VSNISVGDLAAQIMAQDALPQTKASTQSAPSFEEDTSFYSPNVTEQSPDISNVDVPSDFVNNLLEGRETPAPAPAPSVERIVEPLSETTDLKALVQEVRDLLVEVKSTLVEMTTVGALGVNMAGPGKKKKDDEEEDEKDPMKAMLKRIKSRRASS
jgi:hypothetical protein